MCQILIININQMSFCRCLWIDNAVELDLQTTGINKISLHLFFKAPRTKYWLCEICQTLIICYLMNTNQAYNTLKIIIDEYFHY